MKQRIEITSADQIQVDDVLILVGKRRNDGNYEWAGLVTDLSHITETPPICGVQNLFYLNDEQWYILLDDTHAYSVVR